MPSPSLPFFRGWSRDPVAVGLPFPSSPWTARRLAQATLDAAIDGGGPVLELGAGAGAVTQALIEGGCARDQLVVVERDAELCRTLERRFHGLCVLHGDALQMAELLTAAHIASVSVVLSGLPMRAVAPAAAIRCYSSAFRLMPQRRRHHPVHLRLQVAGRSGQKPAAARRDLRRPRMAQRAADGDLELSPADTAAVDARQRPPQVHVEW